MPSIQSRSVVRWLGLLFLVLGAVLVTGFLVSENWRPAQGRDSEGALAPLSPTPSRVPTKTPEPIVPTRTPSLTPSSVPTVTPTFQPKSTSTPTPTSVLILTPTPSTVETPPDIKVPSLDATTSATPILDTATPIPTPTEALSSLRVPPSEQHRLGVSLPDGADRDYGLSALHVGWVMDWSVRADPVLPPGVGYAQTVRMRQGVLVPGVETLTAVAAVRPGSLWLISNEPDVIWQDNVVPEVYARLYHDAYYAIKRGDPSAIVAAGGIAQVTPLRLQYLDLVLQSYQEQFGEPLPAQAWQIHTYMLREERGSWGVDIPPGLPDDAGELYSIEDSGNLDLFRQQIYSFREWMVSRGYRGLPLFVTEFGILMPADYGFPPERVAHFLEETWRFFLTAADPALGDPTDGGRLVQRWCWFSFGSPEYPNGSLIDLDTGEWTPFAYAWFALIGE